MWRPHVTVPLYICADYYYFGERNMDKKHNLNTEELQRVAFGHSNSM